MAWTSEDTARLNGMVFGPHGGWIGRSPPPGTASPLLLTGFFGMAAAQQEKEMGGSFTQLVDLASSMVGSAFHAP
jgi:hypothetical protein